MQKNIISLPEEIIASSGSDSLIQYIVSSFSIEGDEVLSSEGTFIGWYVQRGQIRQEIRRSPGEKFSHRP